MVLELEHGINVVDDWLTLTSSLLEIVSEDLEIPQLEAILIEIKVIFFFFPFFFLLISYDKGIFNSLVFL